MLPPDFKPVNLPLEKRKEIFREAHGIRALAVQEANAKLPMDQAHLPIGNRPAFDKRVAEHKAIIDGLLEANLAALARRNNITVADVLKIEDEASRLRWIPPGEPSLEPRAGTPKPEEKAVAPKPEEKGEAPKAGGDAAK